jgi:uncharacterized damage-inducible protein DinB
MRFLAIAILAAGTLCAQPLTQGERNRLLSELHATRKQFLDAIEGLSPAQWKFKPAPERWSVAECAEHIALSEDWLYQMLAGKLMKSPPQPGDRKQAAKLDEQILNRMADRSQKAQAPGEIQPTGRWKDAAAVAAHFRESRERLLDYVRTTQDPLRSHRLAAGGGEPLDGYQWVMLIAGHTARHVDQIQEVKSSPGFPK